VRRGGALALISAAPACDVLFVGHAGLEGFASVADVWSGALVGRTIRLKFWRERAASIPREPGASARGSRIAGSASTTGCPPPRGDRMAAARR
jgi:hypothetical protein